MRVSVVIPAYNCAALAVEAVRSVLAQTSPVAEIIVVDDGSTDDLIERLKRDPVMMIVQANAGVAEARNAGVAKATGEVIAFLDADDVWQPDKLARQLAVLAADPSIALLGTDIFDHPHSPPVTPADEIAAVVDVPFERLVIRNSLITSSIVVRAEVLLQAGPFDRRMQGPEDYDLWLRVARFGRCAIIPEPLTGYRTVAGSLSKNAARMDAGMALILDKLAAAGAFHDRFWLGRKARGFYHYSAGYMHHVAGHRRAAVGHLMRSLATYPGPYDRSDVRYRFGRLRLLLKAIRGHR
jgi:glycosyltransferase involved in cell wall biosynthesis